jgi:U4/U6.U5 tri-snRNP component SNU23
MSDKKGVKLVEGRRVWDKNVFHGKQETWKQSEEEFSTDEKRKEKKPLEAREEEIDVKSFHGKKKALQPNSEKINEGSFHCDVCSVSFTDSVSFLEHRNSKLHQNKLGMSLQAKRSTVEDVKNKLASLPKKKKTKKPKKEEKEEQEEVEEVSVQKDLKENEK